MVIEMECNLNKIKQVLKIFVFFFLILS